MSRAIIIAITSGSSTTSYAQRPLTSIPSQFNPDGTTASFATLVANQFSLIAGTYRISAKVRATGVSTETVFCILRNVTDSVDVALTEDAQQVAVTDENVLLLFDVAFTLAGTKTFELRGKGSSAHSTTGFGNTTNTPVLAVIDIVKTS